VPPWRDVTIDQPLLDALIEARDDHVLAALVYQIGAAGRRFPDRLLQALVDAEWTSALSLYRDDRFPRRAPDPAVYGAGSSSSTGTSPSCPNPR
jgi:hypothetical protein